MSGDPSADFAYRPPQGLPLERGLRAAAACGRYRRPGISAAAPLAGRREAGTGTAMRQGGPKAVGIGPTEGSNSNFRLIHRPHYYAFFTLYYNALTADFFPHIICFREKPAFIREYCYTCVTPKRTLLTMRFRVSIIQPYDTLAYCLSV